MELKQFRQALIGTLVGALASSVCASGFSLYQPSVISHAMGGALVGKAMDASANFNNPATLTDLTNIIVTAGFVTEHPRGRVTVDGPGVYRDERMDPGLFWLPHFQLAVPLPNGFAFGLAGSADYGLGTKYGDGWPMNWNVNETTVQGFVINPNLAYKIGDFSLAAGLRWLYFDFEQYSNPYCNKNNVAFGPLGSHDVNFGQFQNHLKGNNHWKSVGWQLGMKYDIREDLSVGAVYKSAMDVTVKGRTTTEARYVNIDTWSTMAAGANGMTVPQLLAYQARLHTGDAEADFTLPQSVTAGINWDVTKTWHLGSALSWTEWSKLDSLKFKLQGGDKDIHLGWCDTWRWSIGSCWDFAEDWKWIISYTYDMDCTGKDQSSSMLPPADRHILATGFVWDFTANLQFAMSYSCIFMDGDAMNTYDPFGRKYWLETNWGFCHAGGFSVTYRF